MSPPRGDSVPGWVAVTHPGRGVSLSPPRLSPGDVPMSPPQGDVPVLTDPGGSHPLPQLHPIPSVDPSPRDWGILWVDPCGAGVCPRSHPLTPSLGLGRGSPAGSPLVPSPRLGQLPGPGPLGLDMDPHQGSPGIRSLRCCRIWQAWRRVWWEVNRGGCPKNPQFLGRPGAPRRRSGMKEAPLNTLLIPLP